MLGKSFPKEWLSTQHMLHIDELVCEHLWDTPQGLPKICGTWVFLEGNYEIIARVTLLLC